MNDSPDSPDSSNSPDAPDAPSASEEIAAVYNRLKRVASAQLRRERTDHTLSATGLVHEAYLKLANTHVKWHDAKHFRAIVARAMRQILVDYAHAHRAQKRGGKWTKLTLTGATIESEIEAALHNDIDVIALDEALKSLALIDPRQAKIVELRYFAGLSIADTADTLSLSPATIKREWAVARLYLKRAVT